MMSKSEFELINWIIQNQPAVGDDILTGIGDDMAVIQFGSEKLLITTDMLLEGVHFDLSKATLQQVGYKAMACSISDCAAMASTPVAAVVAVALPNTMTMHQAQHLHAGLQQAAAKYQCPIVGGDTTSWDKPLALNVTMFAHPGDTHPILRSGAKPGDAILVTGSLGGSLTSRHMTFTPRLAEAHQLAQLVDLHAMIDISDGLSIDLSHICEQSRVNAVIQANNIPISPAAQKSADPLTTALHDGEDFELLLCVSESDANQLINDWPNHSHTPLTRIGQITPPTENTVETSSPIMLRYTDGRVEPCPIKGWEHFRD